MMSEPPMPPPPHAETPRAQLAQALREGKEIDAYYENLHPRIELLFKKEKGLLKAKRKLRKPDEPVAFVFRTYGIVDIYEGVRGDTFVIPLGKGKAEGRFAWGNGSENAKPQGRRTAYLTSKDLYEIPWGTDTVKAYFLNENDAQPLNGEPKVWSERLEYTLDAILLNFENYKKKQAGTYDWVPKTVMWVGLGIALFFLVRGLFPQAIPASVGGTLGATPAAANAAQVPANVSGITVIS